MQHLFKVMIMQIHTTQSQVSSVTGRAHFYPLPSESAPIRMIYKRSFCKSNYVQTTQGVLKYMSLMSDLFLRWVYKKALSFAQVSQGEQLLNEQLKLCCVSLLIQFRIILAARLIFDFHWGPQETWQETSFVFKCSPAVTWRNNVPI